MVNQALALLVAPHGGIVYDDNTTHTNRFEIPSASSSRRAYMVAQAIKTGEWQCSCPGWVFKKKAADRRCKHLVAMGSILGKIGTIR